MFKWPALHLATWDNDDGDVVHVLAAITNIRGVVHCPPYNDSYLVLLEVV